MSKGHTLYVRGRDIEECEHGVDFDKVACKWTILGDAAEVRWTDTKTKIIDVLAKAEAPLGQKEISTITGVAQNTVDSTLHRMGENGEVVATSRGWYAHPAKAAAFAEAANSARKKDCKNGRWGR